MKRFFLTYVGFFIFLTTFFITQHHASASGQTSLRSSVQDYRKMFVVKQGRSLDGSILITESSNVKNVPNNAKVPNHLRNLRAFASVDGVGTPVLYLEQSKPHSFYAIRGPFAVPFEKKVFKWTNPTTLTFSATGTDDVYRTFSVNIHTLAWNSSQLGANNISHNLSDGATDVE